MNFLRFLAVAILAGTLAVSARAAEPSEDINAAVLGFYKPYLHALKGEGDTMKKTAPLQKRYLSDRFQKEIARAQKSEDGLEADPFILAQDFDDEWEKTIKIKETLVAGEKASVGLELVGSGMGTRLLEIKLVHVKSGWKIDKARELDKHIETHVEKP